MTPANDRELLSRIDEGYEEISSTARWLVQDLGLPVDMVRSMMRSLSNVDAFTNMLRAGE